MLKTYHPEMDESRPVAPIDASLSHYAKHWFLTTPLVLTGRGVTLQETLRAERLVPRPQHKAGWFQYKVTHRAFEAICLKHDVASEILL